MKTSFVFFAVKRCLRVLALFAAFAGLLLPLQGQAQNVDLYTGTSNYSVPIVTPPGTNGMGPNLSLQYSSGGGNGWVGEGWNLAGLGYIERRGPGYGPAPGYVESTDIFVLNLNGSQKLVYTGADPGTGAAGKFYRTQIESFLRIEFISASNYWVVTDKGGTKYYFGERTASKQTNPNNATQVFSWKLDKVIDTHGVFWSVFYDKIRELNHVSQPIFARYLNTSESTVQKWETGAKRPSGMALKLLSVIQKHGLDVLA